ncbi:hydantoinase/oxoprolinase family protein [Ferrovibrio sp.]|uniref:hydantoinase/oxoprolinase family protein n=1 Tax=Ferrovibrio sp. TaxID=1917215 RepID=UPI001B757EB5|nr:hydantoinase/oxoprolinase family protein [Ferrovibrio sp.]MBP7063271.1 hydantoinase/oxoprolinase family protein [Ferrovibrio sp.]
MSISRSKQEARIAVDIGGTFTDIVLERGGQRWTGKVLTTPQRPAEGFMTAIRHILADTGLAPGEIAGIIHGTTLGTNALIERKGARTAFLTTGGFRDILEIGYENRFDQYDLMIEKPAPLVPRDLRFTVPERVDASGKVILPLDEAALRALVPVLRERGVKSLAIGFLQAFTNPVHEERARAILQQEMPELFITLAAEVCPEIREYDRFSTACANAYIRPIMQTYLDDLERQLKASGFACPIFLITSSGAMTSVEVSKQFPVRLVESGPAGGALLAAQVAQECGLDRVLSFDMGGTTAKICFIDKGQPQTSRSFEVGRVYRFTKGSGLPLRIPVIEMIEIGAGGGSIARVNQLGVLTVGPDSAGSEPGPVCYGRGGSEPTVTDGDFITGRIDAERFARGAFSLDAGKAKAALAAFGKQLDLNAEQAGLAISETIEETMANAARVHAIEGGRDVAAYTMVAFGGAAPLHAVSVAKRLGIRRIIVPSAAGVGSAVGFLQAPIAFDLTQSWYQRTNTLDYTAANARLDGMRQQAAGLIRSATDVPLVERGSVLMRYVGQGHEIEVQLPPRALTAEDGGHLHDLFVAAYVALYGRSIPGLESEVLSWSLRLGTKPVPVARLKEAPADGPALPPQLRRSWTDPQTGLPGELGISDRQTLGSGGRLYGPAAVVESETTTIVLEGYVLSVNEGGYLMIDRIEENQA